MHGHADCDRTAMRASGPLTGPLGWVANPLLSRVRIPAVSLVLVAFSGAAAFLLLHLASANLLPASLVLPVGLRGSALAAAAWLGGAALL